jgi:hypothetical protein
MANSILAKMAVQITANTAQLNKSLKESSTAVSRFQSSITDAAKGLVAGFGAMEVARFTLDVSKLAGEAEGVRLAFEKLPQSAKIMQQLKDVTRGTVSELELMKRAVTATNFGIQLESLPKLLEFATVRAQQTGQSVDYLVDSIVTGIGRKSPLILDNLGISTTRLKEQFGGAALEAQSIGDVAAAVGKIAEEELAKMGRMTENAATRMAKYNAEWENLKVVIGNAVNSVDDTKAFTISKMVTDLTDLFRVLQNNEIANQISERNGGFFASLFPNLDQLFNIREFAKEIDNVRKNTEELARINTEGFIKTPTFGAKIQAEINRLTEENKKQELVKLEALKKQNEERRKAYDLALQFSEQVRRNQEDEALLSRMNPMMGAMFPQIETNEDFNIDEFLPKIEEYDSGMQKLTDTLIANREATMLQQQAWANLGMQISDVIATTIAGGQPLMAAIGRMAAGIISELERITLARMLANSSKFGIGGILAASAGFGIVKGLFAKLGRSGGSVNAGSTRVGRTDLGSRVEFEIRGENLYGVLTNYQRNSRLTTAGG